MKKFYRMKGGWIFGVCKGLSKYFNIDETLIRLLFFVLLFTPFPIIISYLLLWISTPQQNDDEENIRKDY